MRKWYTYGMDELKTNTEDLKETIAANLIRLRQSAGLTQLQLAEMLNYSDKAVSKWERGESIPDLRVLIQLSRLYHITLDDIVSVQPEKVVKPKLNLKKKRLLITLLSVGLVWVIATGVFMILYYTPARERAYFAYVVAPLISFIVFTVFSCLWGTKFTTFLSCSGIVWSVAAIVHVCLYVFAPMVPPWPCYVVAAAIDVLFGLWFYFRKVK